MGTRITSCLLALGLATLVVSPGLFGSVPASPPGGWPATYVLETPHRPGIDPDGEPGLRLELRDTRDVQADVDGATLFALDFGLTVGRDGSETEDGRRTLVWNRTQTEWTGRWGRDELGAVLWLTGAGGELTALRLRWDTPRNRARTTARELRPLVDLDVAGDTVIWFERADFLEALPQVEDGGDPVTARVLARRGAIHTR